MSDMSLEDKRKELANIVELEHELAKKKEALDRRKQELGFVPDEDRTLPDQNKPRDKDEVLAEEFRRLQEYPANMAAAYQKDPEKFEAMSRAFREQGMRRLLDGTPPGD